MINKFKDIELKSGKIALCRLGQHSFLVKTADKLFAFDSYSSKAEYFLCLRIGKKVRTGK